MVTLSPNLALPCNNETFNTACVLFIESLITLIFPYTIKLRLPLYYVDTVLQLYSADFGIQRSSH